MFTIMKLAKMTKECMDFYLAPHLKNEEGQGMVEYGLIIALIAVVVIGALTLMGGSLTDIFGAITGELDEAATPPPVVPAE